MNAKKGVDDSEFPIVCETCLGDNPYVRMTKQNMSRECKVCARPFTVFRWLPGAGMRFKKTEICQTCAKLKNVCQTCLLDLEYGLPTQVRDTVVQNSEAMPKSDVNREWFIRNAEMKMEETGDQMMTYAGGAGKVDSAAKETLKKLTRTDPYYKRNRPHICSFYVKGECKRGTECPYRHEMPDEGELSHQNFKDRYYGTNDPVALKILGKTEKYNGLTPPDDPTIASLFVSNVSQDVTEQDLRGYFYAFGEIKSIVMVYRSKCAFVNFATRAGAEAAMAKLQGNLMIRQRPLRVAWGKPRPQGPSSEIAAKRPQPPPEHTGPQHKYYADSASTSAMPPPPPGAGSISYPSMDPTMLGSTKRDL